MKDQRAKDLAKIHLAKKDLNMAEESYRAVISRVTFDKKTSAADLNYAERQMLLAEMKRLGWNPRRNARKYSPKSGDRKHKTPADKIRALWISMAKAGTIRDGSEKALGRWLYRQYGKYSPDWLTPNDACKAIESLKQWQARVGG